MKRITKKQIDGSWTVCSSAAAIERLAQYECMQEALEQEYQTVCTKMESLRSDGRKKSATYRQLLGNKLQLRDLLDRIALFVK